MLISQLIQTLEKLKSENGDLPVYWKDDWSIHYVSGVWSANIDEDQAENEGLEVGHPIICMCG
jgi:hypothetical protein